MRLERIEINGFKSFSDRSELAFDKGVTAIVGPNGCGKSNVADAITWVMGEQSAKSLRGDKMEDVIFNGSDARKPTATAEVRLRFSGVLKQVTAPAFEPGEGGALSADAAAIGDPSANGHTNGHAESNGHTNGHGHHEAANGNGHHANGNGHTNGHGHGEADQMELIQSVARDVEVTRRLYRSGESEYLIDGHACRLRDINDLLMDTGLGAKAYAIIEQGKIGMILSSRPTDRRQLIEEAAGVTKYKARRRTAELKLEAARQNLTRVDDIVFEVEKQRGTLKRQSGKARRYQKLRDELRRWEKVLFARKYRQLGETIEATRTRLNDARAEESTAAARVAELETHLSRTRIELAEAESSALATREQAHSREMDISRLQQQVAFDKEQVDALSARTRQAADDLEALERRREPARAELASSRQAAGDAEADRARAATQLAAESEAYEAAHRQIDVLEADVESARGVVFQAAHSITALTHLVEHAVAARQRVSETLGKLQVEADDERVQSERAASARESAADGLRKAQDVIEATRVSRGARESELASARIEHEWRTRSVRSREQELAGLEARLKSLEELQTARAEYGDAARTVLAEANGTVRPQGAVADYLEVEAGYERAVEACLGELLQYVVVEQPEQAAAGFALLRDANAGRCGFLVAAAAGDPGQSGETGADVRPATAGTEGLTPMSSVVRVSGPYAAAIRQAIGDGWIADSYEQASAASRAGIVVATRLGDVFRGPHLVTGGGRDRGRGILETKRDLRDLAARIVTERGTLTDLAAETSALEAVMVQAQASIQALTDEYHRQEKAVVGYQGQLQHALDEITRLGQKREQLALERSQAEAERDALDARQDEARRSIAVRDGEKREAEETLASAQRRLLDARESAQDVGRRSAEAGAAHAALVERASALVLDVRRLEDAAAELETRAAATSADLQEAGRRIEQLRLAIVEGETCLDDDVRVLEELRRAVQAGDEAAGSIRSVADEYEASIRTSRADLETARGLVASLDVARATAESDLGHLAQACLDAVQATLDEVLADVAILERDGQAEPDARVICAEEPDDSATGDGTDADGLSADVAAAAVPDGEDALRAAEARTLSAEEAIVTLRGRIDRLGPVNMMAIEQYDELETRHAFLTTQRKDLVDAIAQTSSAIKRIDETTRERFVEAFAAINHNFQQIFSTLFGGGHAGLTLLDENDPLESGIEIIAQPPGKRLQSVQLLSGGEKALTAISLMFGLFKYKPSPFCLLDEIDAPLDDANIGRFVEMLRGMQQHTQFILITHNRKTMEIANRLYGVTMEEPGVSKLISVSLN